MQTDFLIHYGIPGQRWGIRRFQNEDGTLTSAGKERYENRPGPARSKTVSPDGDGIKVRKTRRNLEPLKRAGERAVKRERHTEELETYRAQNYLYGNSRTSAVNVYERAMGMQKRAGEKYNEYIRTEPHPNPVIVAQLEKELDEAHRTAQLAKEYLDEQELTPEEYRKRRSTSAAALNEINKAISDSRKQEMKSAHEIFDAKKKVSDLKKPSQDMAKAKSKTNAIAEAVSTWKLGASIIKDEAVKGRELVSSLFSKVKRM